MSTHTRQMLLAEAQANHGGDRAALLAAIDEAAGTMGQYKPSGGFKSSAGVTSAGDFMMKNARVNKNVARDLVSNAGSSRAGDMGDFAGGAI